jgi:hypothetical protein
MKKSLFLFIAVTLLVSSAVSAQDFFSIRGTVIDSTIKTPINYATITLLQGSIKNKSILTNSDGSFIIDRLLGDNYLLIITAIGFEKKTLPIAINSQSAKTIKLGEINLKLQNQNLSEVQIVGTRPNIKQEIDRTIYNVESDPDSKVVSVFEMFKKVPFLAVDADNKIKLKGQSNFKIFINGRPSNVISRDPEDILQLMPASNIQRIEVITTPPAKYESEGLAGIINIITIKKISDGYNGSVGLSYNSLKSTILNNILNYKAKKWEISSNIGNSWRRFPGSNTTTTRLNFSSIPNNVVQDGNNGTMKGKYRYSFSDISYEIDSLNSIAATLSLERSKGRLTGEQMLRSTLVGGDINNYYTSKNVENTGRTGIGFDLNYQLGFRRNKEDQFTVAYQYSDIGYSLTNRNYFQERIKYTNPDYKQDNSSGTIEHTTQVDYVRKHKKLAIESGIKVILRSNYSDFIYSNFLSNTGEFVEADDKSKTFNYSQNVYSAYNSYYLKMKDWGIKIGARLERTMVKANYASTGTILNREFLNFFPSLAVQHTFDKIRNINLNYSQRIQRPGIWELNPFVNEANPLYFTSGNPDLDPVVAHLVNVNYSSSKTGFLVVGLDYLFSNNSIQTVTVVGTDNISRASFYNTGGNFSIGANINYSYSFSRKLNVKTNSSIRYLEATGIINNKSIKNDGLLFQTSNSLNYRYNKNGSFSCMVGSSSNSIFLQGTSNAALFSSLGIYSSLMNKKATIYASISNPLTKFRRGETQTSSFDFSQISTSRFPYRGILIAFSYKFGRLKDQMKKTKTKIKNDDVSEENIQIN